MVVRWARGVIGGRRSGRRWVCHCPRGWMRSDGLVFRSLPTALCELTAFPSTISATLAAPALFTKVPSRTHGGGMRPWDCQLAVRCDVCPGPEAPSCQCVLEIDPLVGMLPSKDGPTLAFIVVFRPR